MSVKAPSLNPVVSNHWLTGFGNFFAKEAAAWWKGRRWLIQALVYLFIINGMVYLLATIVPTQVQQELAANPAMTQQEREAVQADLPSPKTIVMIFFAFIGLAVGVGTIITMQDAIIGEKLSGTAAWVLSKPISRPAIILSKLTAGMLGITVVGLIIQGLVAWLQLNPLVEGGLAPMAFITGLSIAALYVLFLVTLSLMLGTIFNGRGAVAGIPLGLILGYQFVLMLLPDLVHVGPWALLLPMDTPSLAMQAALGQPLAEIGPIIGTAVASIVFTGVALWRFEREEF